MFKSSRVNEIEKDCEKLLHSKRPKLWGHATHADLQMGKDISSIVLFDFRIVILFHMSCSTTTEYEMQPVKIHINSQLLRFVFLLLFFISDSSWQLKNPALVRLSY